MPDNSDRFRNEIRAAAAERTRLHALGARAPGAAPELLSAYAATRGFIDRLASDEALARLCAGDTEAFGYAVCFLEVYPLCPDSGFAVRDLAKTLKHADIPEKFLPRLRTALLDIARQPARDEFRHLRALALKVADAEFLAGLDTLAESRDIVAAENARVLAAYITRKWSEA